ncbi:MAG: DUF4328 domain-containing protein [Bacteroidales bacterium]|jgi:hypothetical protein|nr:DUF4328 domain-containing protein [Bacteroidales bacterium]
MKKVTDNTWLGKISAGLNVLVFIMFVVSLVLLKSYDTTNVQYVDYRQSYVRAQDKLTEAEKPKKLDSVTVAHYQHRVDTLLKVVPANAKDKKSLNEDIDRVKKLLAEKSSIKSRNDSIAAASRAIFIPIEKQFKALETDMLAAKGQWSVCIWIFVIVLLAKTVVFALWNFKNAKNTRALCAWAKKGSNPSWAFLGWLVPVYNLVKPYAFFSELWNDTSYILEDKKLLPESKKEDNSDLLLGIWWGLFLIAAGLMSIFIHGTFFTTGSLFYNMSHTGVMTVAAIFWMLYLLVEDVLVLNFNKKNLLLMKA